MPPLLLCFKMMAFMVAINVNLTTFFLCPFLHVYLFFYLLNPPPKESSKETPCLFRLNRCV